MTTVADGKNYRVKTYSLPLILAVGFRVRSSQPNACSFCSDKSVKYIE